MKELNIDMYEFPNLKPFDQDSNWAHKYCYDVIKGNVPACNNIKLAAQRHFNDLERTDIYWCQDTADKIVKFFKFVPITDGKDAGKPTLLLPWQIWVVCSIVAWRWSEDTFDSDGAPASVKDERRFLQAVVLIARKAGKTTLAAGIMLFLMAQEPYQPRGYCVATKRDQAKLLWNTAKIMIDLSPRLRGIFETRANEILMPKKHGVFKPLASDHNSLDGLNGVCIIGDELHSWKSRNLWDVCVSSFGARTEYLMLAISTAGFLLDNILVELVKNAEQTLRGNIDQDHFFYAVFQIDKDDDWTDINALYKANAGMFYGLPSVRYIKNQLTDAKLSVDSKGAFLTKHCNLFVSGTDKWLDIDQFRKGARDIDFDDFRDRECWVGFDRSMISDITSATVTFADDDGGITEFVFNIQSRGAIDKAGDYLRSIYHKAEETDDLRVVPGEYIRDSHIKELIRWLWEQLPKCRGVYYDPYKMKGVALDLEEEGIEMISVSMGPGNVSEPAKKVESLIADELFRYKNSVLLEYAVMCALVDVSKYGNMMVYRDKLGIKTDRIDPLIATILGISGATLIKNAENVYESRGLLSI